MNTLYQYTNLGGHKGNLVKLAKWIEMGQDKDIPEAFQGTPECAQYSCNEAGNVPDVKYPSTDPRGYLEKNIVSKQQKC